MAYTNKRVGISYISDKSNLSDLYNEEILIDKLTGEVYVKTPKGNVISFNYLTRRNTHLYTLMSNTYAHAMLKSLIMEITPDNMSYPATNGILNTNLIGDSPIALGQGCFKTMISIDLDCVDTISGEVCNNTRLDMPVSYEIRSVYFSTPVRVYSGETTLAEFNNIVFEFPEPNDNIIISKLIIGESPQATSVRYILNSICGLFNTNGMKGLGAIVVVQQHTNEQFRTTPFNTSGIILEAHDGNQAIEITNYTYEIFYVDGENLIPDGVDGSPLQYAGTHRIVFGFGKLSTSYDFEVSEEQLVELYMISEPNRYTYEFGEEFDPTGMELQGVYNTGIVAEVTDYEISGFDSTKSGECCVTIGCDNCYVDCTVYVVPHIWTYLIENNEVMILSYLGRDRVVNVPSVLEGYPVVRIGRFAFYQNPYVKTVNIPDTVKYIG